MPRVWRVQATLTMPRFIRKEPGESRQFNTFNLFPAQRLLVRESSEIWMKCKESVTQAKSGEVYKVVQISGDIESSYRDPTKCPYFLESKVNAESGSEAVSKVIGAMETITDFLTFQLQYPVKIVRLEAHSPSQSVSGEFDIIIYSGTPDYRIAEDAVAVFHDSGYMTFDPYWIRSDPEEEVAAALRWFSKGLAESTLIDKFALYWIAFETLATHWPGIEAKHYMECPRCQKVFPKCPLCGQNTDTFPKIAERARRVGSVLGRGNDLIGRLWSTRQLVHGTMQLKDPKEIEELPQLTQQLKALVIDAIKARLGVPSSEPPLAETNVLISWSTMALKGTTKDLTWPADNCGRECAENT